MLDQAYLASAIARFPLVVADDSGWCNTLATDGYFIYVNTNYCAGLKVESISFIIAHEVLHCVLGHIDRRKDRQPRIWNFAIDYATNGLLVDFGFKMPGDGLYDRKYRGMTAETIYKQLVQSASKKTGPSSFGKQGAGGKQATGGKQGAGKKPGSGFDLHLDPDDERGRQLRGKEFPSPEERKRIRVLLTNEISRKTKGTVAGLMEEEIRKATQSEVPWRALLSRFFSGIRKDDYRMMPPNKKHISRGIYLPSMGVPGPDHLIAAIDTSGSMDERELSKILSEIDSLRSVTQCALTLIQCDAEIQDVKYFDEFTEASFEKYKFIGRGGTSFLPVFDWITENIYKEFSSMDALIYSTDGFGDFPEKPPSYPVLWIMTEHSIPKVPFGEVIRMKKISET